MRFNELQGSTIGMLGVNAGSSNNPGGYTGNQYRNVAMNDQTDRAEPQMLHQFIDNSRNGLVNQPGGIGQGSIQ